MKAIILSDMDKLLSPIEQAQKLGIIKTQIQMKSNEKQNYISIGIIVTCVVILGGLLILHLAQKKYGRHRIIVCKKNNKDGN